MSCKILSYLCFSLFVLVLLIIGSCEKEDETENLTNKVEFADFTVSDISYKTAQVSSKIPETYGLKIEQYGHCWSLEQNPNISDSISVFDEYSSDFFESDLQDLNHNTIYYVRAYFKVGDLVKYSDEISFKTLEIKIPIVTTKEYTNLTAKTIETGGEVTDGNGGKIFARGVCWSKLENPTISDSLTIDSLGLGVFNSNPRNLEINTTYYLRAYATNEAGTGYGNEISFTTREGIPIINTIKFSEITFSSLKSGGEIITDEGSAITEKGVCWNTSGAPTIDDIIVNSGSGSESFECYLEDLQEGSTYYVRAYATNVIGTAYGNELSVSLVEGAISVKDYDGNWYNTVKIGNQIWLKEDLKTTHYPDGTSIANGAGIDVISEASPKYYFAYDDEESNVEVYGRLYTWYAAKEACPDGWHMPTKSEWDILLGYVGSGNAGKLKSTGTIEEGTGLWKSPNTGATDEFGFSLVPTGRLNSYFPSYIEMSESVFYNFYDDGEYRYAFGYNSDEYVGVVSSNGSPDKDGYPVRCIKDE